MCKQCWEGYDSPKLNTPDIRACAQRIRDLYATSNGSTGGHLHIVTDDWNLDDANLNFCRSNHTLTEIESDILDYMETMTLAERASVLALFDGWFEVDEK